MLRAAITTILRTATCASGSRIFTAAGVPATQVAGLEESVRSDIARRAPHVHRIDGVALVRLPWLADGKPSAWSGPAPRLGEHTREVLAELGYADAR